MSSAAGGGTPGATRNLPRFLTGARELLGERITEERKAREKVARDQSIYRRLPAAVASPRDPEELSRLLRLAAENRVPLTPRGGGSGTGGGAITSSVVITLRGEYWEAPPTIREEGAVAIVRPGISYARLADALAPYGRYLPADPSSGAISTIGGNIATRASGPHAFRHGSIDRYITSLSVVDGSGELIETGVPRGSGAPGPFSAGRTAALEALRRGISPALEESIGRQDEIKTAAGPRLSPFLADPGAPEAATSLFCGSMGSYGIVTEAVLRTVANPRGAEVVLYVAESDAEAVGLVRELRGPETAAVEIIDALALRIAGRGKLLETGLLSDRQARMLAAPEGHLLIHERTPGAPLRRDQGQTPLPRERTEELWKYRKGMLWGMGRFNKRFRAYSIINDLAVPRDRLLELIRGVRRIAAEEAVPLPFYGHAGDANLHFRPLFQKARRDLPKRLRAVATGAYELTTALGGTISGEHGLGPLRAAFLELQLGEEGVELYRELGKIFDPQEILNPGSLVPTGEFLDGFEPF